MTRKLSAGVYRDDGELRIDTWEICQALGVPYTRENCAVIEEEAIAAYTEVFGPPSSVTIVEMSGPPPPKPN